MIDTQAIRNRILILALRGQLIPQDSKDTIASKMVAELSERIKGQPYRHDIDESEIPYEIPDSWIWCRLSDIGTTNIGLTYHPEDISTHGTIVARSSNIVNGKMDYSDLMKVTCQIRDNQYLDKNDILICARNGSKALVGKCAIFEGDSKTVAFGAFMAVFRTPLYRYVYYYFNTPVFKRNFISDDSKQINQVTQNTLKQSLIPLPPLTEQQRIVEKIEQAFSALDTIDTLQAKYADNLTVMKGKLIDAAIQGKLTEQLPEDGTAEELYQQIQAERQRQEAADMIKTVDLAPDIPETEIPFTIPSNWKWTNLGNISYIVRGGSPRPIKQYITSREDGINWIKIGDVEKGGKYISSTHEKIIPEGEAKSRRVYPGDFLLTNSMSFGRPYISKIEGCIHDGWLLIHDLKGFNPDYLYYLLSSSYLFGQFTEKASGSTVDNLNIDKVKAAIIPLPPIAEQERIVARVTELLALCNGISNTQCGDDK